MFHRVRPVFVFDGATPALKRNTNIARRRRREAQQGVLRKTAEKLLIAQLKKQVGEGRVRSGSRAGGQVGGSSCPPPCPCVNAQRCPCRAAL
jgi:hypothetical protein